MMYEGEKSSSTSANIRTTNQTSLIFGDPLATLYYPQTRRRSHGRGLRPYALS